MSSHKDTYEWLSAKDHVKKRVGMYVGSHHVSEMCGHAFHVSEESKKLTTSTISCTTNPVIFKLFDEAVSNALDNSRKDETQKYIKATVNPETGTFSVTNDGKSIPVKLWENTDRYLIEILFSETNAGSNFAEERGKTLGMNGLGITVTNILSEWFEVFVVNVEEGKKYKQKFTNNASIIGKPKISDVAKSDTKSSVTVTWKPDITRFNVTLPFDEDVVKLLSTRMYDVAACSRPNLSVYFNDKKLAIKSMKDYSTALGGVIIGSDKVQVNDETVFEICVSSVNQNSNDESRVVAFVNGIQCSQGTHVDLVHRRLLEALNEIVKKRMKKSAQNVRPQLLKESLVLLINLNIDNPSFTSQTKEKLDTSADKFGFKYLNISASLFKQLEKSTIVDDAIKSVQDREDKEVAKSVSQTRRQKHMIPKYHRAMKKHSSLYLTEGMCTFVSCLCAQRSHLQLCFLHR